MPLDDILLDTEEHMEKAIEHLKHELRTVRTGRASPAMVEHIKVEYYGTPTDMRSIASISVPEATQILIKPFSPGDLKWIEKAINDSKLPLTSSSLASRDRRRLSLRTGTFWASATTWRKWCAASPVAPSRTAR